jgi:glycosyltransferase involved in cell wall biosynthesis
MTKVAFVHNGFPAGGAERITVDIARYLKSVGGYQVYVYTTKVDQTLVTKELSDIMTIRLIPSQAIQTRRSAAVEKYIVEDGIDVLVQVTKALKGIEEIRKRTGCRTVVACHGEPFWQRHAITFRRQKGLVRKMMWNLYNRKRYEDGTLAMRKAVERTRREYDVSDAYTVLCEPYKDQIAAELGIDAATSQIYPIENPERLVEDICWEKDNVVMFCGRFENWSKRVDRLLRIWSKVQDRLPQWRLVLVGDGADGAMLRQMAQDLDLQRVSFEGMQKNIAGYYDRASVVAMTSETEGWPLALSEAQAYGCIGIAFGCTAGVSEILGTDGECGFVVPPFDEDKYAETLVNIASMSEDEKMRIRRNAVERRRRYAPEVIAEKWRQLFDSLVSRG